MTEMQRWREASGLTQVEAALQLGISQTYLSLVEKGARPVTRSLRDRLDAVRTSPGARESVDDWLRAQLSALGYPGFAHVDRARPRTAPAVLLLRALGEPTVDTRVADALPWLVKEYGERMDWRWLVQQAKLRDLQNRLGFLVQLVSGKDKSMSEVLKNLEKARLIAEATFCRDSMPAAMRELVRARRSPEAAYWNVVSLMRAVDSGDRNARTG